ncbi:MAG: choice-of-anchor P family protein [Pseudonocardiales bacterium]
MNSWTRGKARLAAVTGLAAVIAIGMAAPASAAANDTSSYGLKCTGSVTCGPFAQSAYPAGPASNSLANANVAGLVTTGVINTSANSNGANASVNDLSVVLTRATLNATTVSSTCSINSNGSVSGSSSIVGGQIVIIGGTPITLASSPAPNSTVLGLTGIATVVLNRQTTAGDGTLTVDAIFITLLNGETVTVASSSCTPTGTGVPMATGKGLLLGGGLLGLLVLGYAVKRRPFLARRTA